jgi:hypothetical protein
MYPKRRSDGTLIFPDYPEFKPNIDPRQIFEGGTLCGGYFRRVYSNVAKRYLETTDYKKYPFLKDLPEKLMTVDIDKKHNHEINKYGVHSSLSLQDWEKFGWIRGDDFRGWIAWYIEFYAGRRIKEIDDYQVKRWRGIASAESGRFRKNLIRQIYDAKKKWNDESVSPVIRQTLWNWAYQLTQQDYKEGVKELLEKRKNEKKKSKKHSKKNSKKTSEKRSKKNSKKTSKKLSKKK